MNSGLTTTMYVDRYTGVECYIGHRNWVDLGFKVVARAKTSFQGIPVVFYKNAERRYVISPETMGLYEINFKSASDFSRWWKYHKDSYKDIIKVN